MTDVGSFMGAGAAVSADSGNTPWARTYSHELQRVAREHAARAPRSNQAHLGPSELGCPCSRQVAGKMAGLPHANRIADPWASIVGTAVHAWLADAFNADNTRYGQARWAAEQRVTPHPEHPGTADLYDARERAVIDHKVLGTSSMAKVRSAQGPPVHYQVQLLLYGHGYRLLGLPVDRVVLAAWPRTSHEMHGLYLWDRETQGSDHVIIEEVFRLTAARAALADDIVAGRSTLHDVPATPAHDTCYFCPFYRPDAEPDNLTACNGT